jgi:hypothetical protein
MTNAAIAAKIHQALDTHCNFAAQITFDRKAPDGVTQACDFRFTQIPDLRRRIDACTRADGLRASAADAVDVRQCDPDVFIDGNIDPCNSCHGLSLTLLVTRIRADDTYHAIASNDFAIATDFSD